MQTYYIMIMQEDLISLTCFLFLWSNSDLLQRQQLLSSLKEQNTSSNGRVQTVHTINHWDQQSPPSSPLSQSQSLPTQAVRFTTDDEACVPSNPICVINLRLQGFTTFITIILKTTQIIGIIIMCFALVLVPFHPAVIWWPSVFLRCRLIVRFGHGCAVVVGCVNGWCFGQVIRNVLPCQVWDYREMEMSPHGCPEDFKLPNIHTPWKKHKKQPMKCIKISIPYSVCTDVWDYVWPLFFYIFKKILWPIIWSIILVTSHLITHLWLYFLM